MAISKLAQSALTTVNRLRYVILFKIAPALIQLEK